MSIHCVIDTSDGPSLKDGSRASYNDRIAALALLADGIHEDMMVAMLQSVQSAAAACAEVCIERMRALELQMLLRISEEGLERSPNSPRLRPIRKCLRCGFAAVDTHFWPGLASPHSFAGVEQSNDFANASGVGIRNDLGERSNGATFYDLDGAGDNDAVRSPSKSTLELVRQKSDDACSIPDCSGALESMYDRLSLSAPPAKRCNDVSLVSKTSHGPVMQDPVSAPPPVVPGDAHVPPPVVRSGSLAVNFSIPGVRSAARPALQVQETNTRSFGTLMPTLGGKTSTVDDCQLLSVRAFDQALQFRRGTASAALGDERPTRAESSRTIVEQPLVDTKAEHRSGKRASQETNPLIQDVARSLAVSAGDIGDLENRSEAHADHGKVGEAACTVTGGGHNSERMEDCNRSLQQEADGMSMPPDESGASPVSSKERTRSRSPEMFHASVVETISLELPDSNGRRPERDTGAWSPASSSSSGHALNLDKTQLASAIEGILREGSPSGSCSSPPSPTSTQVPWEAASELPTSTVFYSDCRDEGRGGKTPPLPKGCSPAAEKHQLASTADFGNVDESKSPAVPRQAVHDGCPEERRPSSVRVSMLQRQPSDQLGAPGLSNVVQPSSGEGDMCEAISEMPLEPPNVTPCQRESPKANRPVKRISLAFGIQPSCEADEVSHADGVREAITQRPSASNTSTLGFTKTTQAPNEPDLSAQPSPSGGTNDTLELNFDSQSLDANPPSDAMQEPHCNRQITQSCEPDGEGAPREILHDVNVQDSMLEKSSALTAQMLAFTEVQQDASEEHLSARPGASEGANEAQAVDVPSIAYMNSDVGEDPLSNHQMPQACEADRTEASLEVSRACAVEDSMLEPQSVSNSHISSGNELQQESSENHVTAGGRINEKANEAHDDAAFPPLDPYVNSDVGEGPHSNCHIPQACEADRAEASHEVSHGGGMDDSVLEQQSASYLHIALGNEVQQQSSEEHLSSGPRPSAGANESHDLDFDFPSLDAYVNPDMVKGPHSNRYNPQSYEADGVDASVEVSHAARVHDPMIEQQSSQKIDTHVSTNQLNISSEENYFVEPASCQGAIEVHDSDVDFSYLDTGGFLASRETLNSNYPDVDDFDFDFPSLEPVSPLGSSNVRRTLSEPLGDAAASVAAAGKKLLERALYSGHVSIGSPGGTQAAPNESSVTQPMSGSRLETLLGERDAGTTSETNPFEGFEL